MSRTFQLLVVAYLVCSTAVILLHLTETVLSLLLAILGLVLVLWILIRWCEVYGRRTDPNFDTSYAAHSRKYQFYMMTTMMFLMVVYLFPVSDWKFWLCMACLVPDAVFRYSWIRDEQSAIRTKLASNTHKSRINTTKDDPQ